jgi:DNA-binding NtrC family response regulator
VDADAALGDATVSGVIIASATNSHLDQALQAAAAGKAIFCEKPIDLERACNAAMQLETATMLRKPRRPSATTMPWRLSRSPGPPDFPSV